MTFIASKQIALQVEELIKVLEGEMDCQEVRNDFLSFIGWMLSFRGIS
jgi:hypothetical protein